MVSIFCKEINIDSWVLPDLRNILGQSEREKLISSLREEKPGITLLAILLKSEAVTV